MSKFGHYTKQGVTADATSLFVFRHLEGTPSLTCRPATRHNKAYTDAAKKNQAWLSRLARAGASKQADIQAREIIARMFADTIVTGWPVPPTDTDGKEVEFSTDNCYDFLMAIPDYMFDDATGNVDSIVRFCSNPLNFSGIDHELVDEEDVEQLAKN